MAHPDRYSKRIVNEFGKLTLITTGYKDKGDYEYDFYKIDEDGKCYCRNLYTSMYCGYSLTFPGMRARSYYGERLDGKFVEEEWNECNKIIVFNENINGVYYHESDLHMILEKYPKFKYTLEKWYKLPISEIYRKANGYYHLLNFDSIFSALIVWKEHPETEFLLQHNLSNFAFKKGFWKLSEKKRRALVTWAVKNEKLIKDMYLSYMDVNNILKYKLTWEEYVEYTNAKSRCYTATMSVPLYRYLRKNNMDNCSGYELYRDYAKLAKDVGHDMKEEYWKYPSHFRDQHAKVLDEVNAIYEANRIAAELRQKQAKREEAKKHRAEISMLSRVVMKLADYNQTVNGYDIFFTANMDDWMLQAEKLHQCIIRCGYWREMASKSKVLAFIRKDGEPVATIELFAENRIGQFYADEHSGRPEGSLPSDEVSEAVNIWLEGKPDFVKLIKSRKSKVQIQEVA